MQKRVLIFLLIVLAIILLSSCEKHFHTEEVVVATVTDTSFVPDHQEYKYGYGYSFMKGKMCWHWGYFHESAKYVVHLNYDNKDYAFNNKKLYDSITNNKLNEVDVYLRKVYKVVDNDTSYVEERIHI